MTAVDPDVVAADVARLRADGFVVVAGLLSASDVRECRAALAPNLARERFGRNPFDGVPSLEDAQLVPAVMPSGSAIVFLGTLWHRGGANRSAAPRLALSTQYCEPWARQQENSTLAIPPEVVATLDERVQELLEYSIHPPFMGHTGGLHPKRRLHPEPA